MERNTYKITLADGTILDDLRRNGDNFISRTAISSGVFDGNCSPVVISDGAQDELHPDMELVQIAVYAMGEHWFVLRDIPAQELERLRMQSDIEYVAMMAGVEL